MQALGVAPPKAPASCPSTSNSCSAGSLPLLVHVPLPHSPLLCTPFTRTHTQDACQDNTNPEAAAEAAAEADIAEADTAEADTGAEEPPTNTDDDAPSGRKEGTAAKAFRRVVAEEWLGQKGSWDNSYEATFGQAGWGAKANQVLSKVRGKDFRHEKTKKKRGTYRGGNIEPGMVASYKFESSDEE